MECIYTEGASIQFFYLTCLIRLHYPIDEVEQSGNDYCYRLHHVGLTWDEAVEVCAGSMLFFESMEELEFVKQQIFLPQGEKSLVWLAGRKNLTGNSSYTCLMIVLFQIDG